MKSEFGKLKDIGMCSHGNSPSSCVSCKKGDLGQQEEQITETRQQYASELAREQALKDQARIDELMREINEIKGNTPEKQQREAIFKELESDEVSYKDIKDKIPPEFLKDKSFIIEMLKKQHTEIVKDLSEEMKGDRDFALEMIKANRYVFKEIGESLQNDEEFLIEGIKVNESLLYAVPENLRNNKDFILELSEAIGSLAIEVMGGNLRDDRELLLQFAKKGALEAIRFASGDLQKDEEFVLEIVKTILQRSSPERIDSDLQWALNGWDDPGFQDKYFNNPKFMDKVNKLKREALLKSMEKEKSDADALEDVREKLKNIK